MKKFNTLFIFYFFCLTLACLNLPTPGSSILMAATTTDPAPDCGCEGGVLTNGSFESGTAGWKKTGSASFYTNGEYLKCGSKNGVIDASNYSGSIYQDIKVVTGSKISFKGWGGTHNKNYTHQFRLVFYTAEGTKMADTYTKFVDVDYVVSGGKLKYYEFSATAPAQAAVVRVEAYAAKDYLKVEAVCVKVDQPSYCTDCVDNKLTNGSFENGTTGWNKDAGTTLNAEAAYKVCGEKGAAFNGKGKFWQDVNAVEFSTVTLKIFGARHESSNQVFQLVFLDINGAAIGSPVPTSLLKKLDTSPWGLKLYTINAIAPAGTRKVRVQGSQTGNWIKVDAACLTITEPTISCDCGGNALMNGSFEEGAKDWTLSQGTDFAREEFYKVCGDHFGVIKGSGSIYQEVAISYGYTVNFTVWGGTHNTSKDHFFKLTFYDKDGVKIEDDNANKAVHMDHLVSDNHLKEYIISTTAPANAAKLRIEASSNGDFFKIDAACVTIAKGPLPVTLVDFTAKKELTTTVLAWTTTEETNSSSFEVEHSNNGKTWNNVGSVAAKGESTSLVYYDFVHNVPANGSNFYRLKMVDADATFSYSRMVTLKFELADAISIYPNPTADYMKVNVSNDKIVKVQLYNVQGVLVMDTAPDAENRVDLHHLKPGSYVVKLSQFSGLTSTRRVQIVK